MSWQRQGAYWKILYKVSDVGIQLRQMEEAVYKLSREATLRPQPVVGLLWWWYIVNKKYNEGKIYSSSYCVFLIILYYDLVNTYVCVQTLPKGTLSQHRKRVSRYGLTYCWTISLNHTGRHVFSSGMVWTCALAYTENHGYTESSHSQASSSYSI